jgi:hypothetical protein
MLLSMTVTARESWTDERLDDLNVRIEKRFDEVDQRFDRVEADIREVRGDIAALRSETKAGFDSLQQTMIIGFVTIAASVAGALAVLAT